VLVSITFVTSPSHLFPVALEIAGQADKFTASPIEKITRYQAQFGATQAQAELAVALLGHLDSLKGVLVYAGDRMLVNQDTVIATLACFIAAQAGGGAEHYCAKSIEIHDPEYEHKHQFDIGYVAPPRYTVPCARLVELGFAPDVQAGNVNAQIRAEAARAGCDWCPNFKPQRDENFRRES
jgi:hypothetical protein